MLRGAEEGLDNFSAKMLAKMRTAFATLAILVTLAARVFAQDPGSNATTNPDHPYSSVWLWTALGDSFSAGIGAGAEYDDGGSGDCRRRQGAHAVQLNPLMSPFVRFSFRSCSSAKMDDVQTKQLPELQADKIADQHLVLLSIGGNDADFATLVDACITQAWYGSCDKRLAVANENIDGLAAKIEKLFKNIVRAVRDAEGDLNFRMIVTGYPRFFNSETTLCNTRSMGFWPLWKPKLTQELRRTINGLVDRMNRYLKANVEIANEELGRDRVFYVDPNPEFDGHRFCEEGVMEPDDSANSPSWFFLLRGTDRESVVEDPVQLVPDECDRLLALESVTLGDEWGRQMMCAIGKHMSEGMIPEPWVGVNGTDPNQPFLPEQYAKFFHPKTAGHAAYKRAIMRTLQTIQDRPLRAATVMHRGTPEQFAELRDSFGTNPFNPVRVLQQDGIDVRGFLTWMTVDTAVAVKASRSDVLGVSYEDESMTRDSVAGREPTFPSKSRRSRVPAGQEQVAKQVPERRATFVRRADGDGGVSALAQEPVTNTNLDMQYAIVPEREWHLNMISTPPAFPPEDATQQDRLYFKYPGYVYDPNAGGDVAVYSLDMGANLDHLTLKGRVGSTFVAGNWPQGDGKLDHGTCMASLTSGSTVGVNRGGTINIVKYFHNGQLASITRADMLLESLLWILKDVRDKGKQKRAVISFSTGIPSNFFWDKSGIDTGDLRTSDPWFFMLPLLHAENVIVVTPAGNSGLPETVEYMLAETPRRYALDTDEPRIVVVGAVDANGVEWPGSNRFTSIIAAWAPGFQVYCASGKPNGYLKSETGTSVSTAITSGIIAGYLDRADLQARLNSAPNFQIGVIELLRELAEVAWNGTFGTLPVVNTFNYVRCQPVVPARKRKRQDDGDGNGELAPFKVVRDASSVRTISRQECINNQATATVDEFTYRGCFDLTHPLEGDESDQPNLASCAAFCRTRTGIYYRYFAMVGRKCTCGNLDQTQAPRLQHECNLLCNQDYKGDDAHGYLNRGEVCGGNFAGRGSRMSLYGRSTQAIGGVDGWRYDGCFVDSASQHALTGPQQTLTDMTPARCAAFCCNFRYFGVGSGNQCFCANELTAAKTSDLECATPCAGAGTLHCGGTTEQPRLTTYEQTLSPGGPIACLGAPNCGLAPASCDLDSCKGGFNTTDGKPYCRTDAMKGCACIPSTKNCGTPQSCDAGGCGGTFDVATGNATCKEKYATCQCKPTTATCSPVGSPVRSCDDNHCNGHFNATDGNAYCSDFFKGCQCQATKAQCGALQPCEKGNCNGGFNLTDGKAYCRDFFKGCECEATTQTCGVPQKCTSNNCAGKFNATDGIAYCSNFFKGCQCDATPETCAAPQSCTKGNCAGKFDISNGKAFCTNFFRGCECLATPDTCGDAQNCDFHSCAGRFSATDGKAYCTNFFKGCQCLPGDTQCGDPQSCDKGNCVGKYSLDDGKAYCSNFYKGCECLGTKTTCGAKASCEGSNCNGRFDVSNGKAYCSGWFEGCECQAVPKTCGAPQDCGKSNCDGHFDQSSGIAYCSNFFAGCRCTPNDDTCGNPQKCETGGCDGAYVGNSNVARCRNKWAGCKCTPTAATCGDPKPCDDGGCVGKWDDNGVPRCSKNFKGCVCLASGTTCGNPARCQNNNCNGVYSGNGYGVCLDAFEGCKCLPDAATPGFCDATIGYPSCSAGNCQGQPRTPGSSVGSCMVGSTVGCACAVPKPSPPPPPSPPSCERNCQDLIGVIRNAEASMGGMCAPPPSGLTFPDKGTSSNRMVDWWVLGSVGDCYLSMGHSSPDRGFDGRVCVTTQTQVDFMNQNALGCNSGSQFFRTTGVFSTDRWSGGLVFCLSNGANAHLCGSSDMNGGTTV